MQRTSFRRAQAFQSILGNPERKAFRGFESHLIQRISCQASVAVHAQVSYTWTEWFDTIAWHQKASGTDQSVKTLKFGARLGRSMNSPSNFKAYTATQPNQTFYSDLKYALYIMRVRCDGRTGAFQALSRGSTPLTRSTNQGLFFLSNHRNL